MSGLSRPHQVVYFFRDVLGVPVGDKAVLSKRTGEYRSWVEAFARNHHIPMEWAEKGVRKEDYARPRLRRMERAGQYGVYFIFQSMEQGATFRWSMPKFPTQDPNHRSPCYPSAADYYALSVRAIYRSYPVYTPDKEPAGYWESLQQKEPQIIFDAAKSETKEDWIRGGQAVFESSIALMAPSRRDFNLAMLKALPGPTTKDGIIHEMRYASRKKGVVEMGVDGCSECHARILPDGTAIEGPPTNEPLSRRTAWRMEQRGFGASTEPVSESAFYQRMYAAPWVLENAGDERNLYRRSLRRLSASPFGDDRSNRGNSL